MLLKERIIELARSSSHYEESSGDNAKIDRFLELFPKSNINKWSLEQYVLGEGANPDNFCRWIERELQTALGRYMPGTAKGHMLYLMQGGDLYKLKSLEPYSDSEALNYTLRLHQCIANVDIDTDMSWLDHDKEISDKANVPESITVAAGRKLRILQVYNHEHFLPISSVDHLGYFLRRLGVKKTELPNKNQPIARSLMLRDQLLQLKDQAPDLTPYGFMKILYGEELGIRPVVRKHKPTEKIDSSNSSSREELMPPSVALNQILYGPPGTGKTYATTDLAVKIIDRAWYDENRKNLSDIDFREEVKKLYDKLAKQGQIKFVTFHQSFSYEDFVEGIRANSNEGAISYDIEDGVFKSISDAAIN